MFFFSKSVAIVFISEINFVIGLKKRLTKIYGTKHIDCYFVDVYVKKYAKNWLKTWQKQSYSKQQKGEKWLNKIM